MDVWVLFYKGSGVIVLLLALGLVVMFRKLKEGV